MGVSFRSTDKWWIDIKNDAKLSDETILGLPIMKYPKNKSHIFFQELILLHTPFKKETIY
tara:strand:+ start:224 stop:403 length:180 start_codon:yes stop_codon:yes gene_type:complete